MIKAIFFDIDGTLVSFQTHRMPQSTIDALWKLKEKGVKLFIATGRAPTELAFLKDDFPFDGYVTMNGQYCYCGRKIIYENRISPEAVEGLTRLAGETEYSFCFVEPDDLYVDKVTGTDLHVWKSVNIPVPKICALDYPKGRAIYQIVASIPAGKEALITEQIPDVEIARWHPLFVDLIPKGGGKECGLEAMLGHFGLKQSECMAFGDGENDISMLRYAAVGIAMGNADEKVQKAAVHITDTVDEEGIKRALQHYGLL